MFLAKKALWLLLQLPFLPLCSCSPGFAYYRIAGSSLLCIRPEFIRTMFLAGSKIWCSVLCSREQRCQAYTMADGPCQLFVFDKCSKSVRDCNCTRRGQVFVKQQPGLEAGQLCPTGYGDDLCGVKYKLYSGTGDWSMSRQKCESESGLVIMADVTDATEMSRVDQIYSSYSAGKSFWLGGFRSASIWQWVACNISLDASLWGSGEPNNGNQNAVYRSRLHTRLADAQWNDANVFAVLCECVSPFN